MILPTIKLNWSILTILIGLIALHSTRINAQTGAAGVGNSGTQPMWYDANELNISDGSLIAQVDDISGNNNHLTQSTSSRRPVFTENGLNGLPVMTFDGVNDFLTRGATAGLDVANLSYFIVFQRATNLNECLIDAGYPGFISKWTTYSTGSNNRLISMHKSPTKFVFHVDNGTPSFVSTHITSANLRQYKQGTLQQNLNTPYTAGVGHNLIRVGAYNYNLTTGYYLNGFIAEIIVYNTALSDLQRILIENYLGAKYNMAIPSDLYAYEATHNIGLIAVANNGVNSQTSAQGSGILEISAPTAMTSNEYFLTGHTNEELNNFTTTDVPVSLVGFQRWTRTWIADETGEVGNITLTYYLSGGNNFGDGSSYTLLVDNVTQDGDFSDATQVAGIYDSGLQTITFTTNINDGDEFTLCGEDLQIEIHAINDGLWSNTNTWDCVCIPNANDDVFIDANVSVTVDMNAEAGYFSVGDPGGTLIMDADFTLDIYEDWDMLGTANLTAGQITMMGVADQYLDAGGNTLEFNDLEINNSGGGTVTFYESQYILNGTFYPTLGSLTMDPAPGNQFIINSTSATTTGRIAPVGTSFAFNGTYTVRRFIPAGIADYRDLGSPVNGAQLWMWDNSIAISGLGFPDGCAFGTECFYSVQYYNTYNGGGSPFDVTDILAPLVVGRGYEVFIGDDLNTFSGATLEVQGTLNDGQDVVIAASSYYSTRSNPYASPIMWDNIIRSGVGDYFYVYDNATGFYEYYDGSDQSSSIPDLASGIIDMGQGFWVVGPGTLTFTDGSKVPSGMFIRNSIEDKSITLRLKENNSTYSSSIALQQAGESSDDMDFLLDVPLLTTGAEKAPTIAMYSVEEELIRKNYIKDDFRNKSFELYTKILNAGYYTIEASNIENFNNYLKVLLYDNMTGQFVNLKTEPTYTFHSDVTEGHRFTLIFSNEDGEDEESIQALIINEEIENGLTITQMGHTFNIVSTIDYTEDSQIKLVNVLGQQEVFYQSVKFVNGSNMITIPEEYKGVHILVITTGNKTVTKKVVL